MAEISNGSQKITRPVLVLCLLLIGLVAGVFGQAVRFDFTNYDDPLYVTAAPAVKAGITVPGVIWSFTHSHAWNWHPLTTISHMVDCQLFGLRPGPHHFTNICLHSLAVVLLFLVLREMTRAMWRSAFVAAVFAIHPLRVESVAWIAERKDVLSGVFFMLTLAGYLHYTRERSIGSYFLVIVLFACGLMSKPMLVTVPFLLLLLDYWPLNRFNRDVSGIEPKREEWFSQQSVGARLILEKVPMLLLSAAVCVVTIIVQQPAAYTAEVPLATRVINGVLSCGAYIHQMFWPVKLAPFYPYRVGALSIWILGGVVLVLGVITAAAVLLRKQYPYVFTGWFWYLIMLVPVIGIIRVGSQAQADRYTYLPQIGLYLALTWAITDLTVSWRYRRPALAVGAITAVIALGFVAFRQTSYWKNSESLWNHTLAVTRKNPLAHNNLGSALAEKGQIAEAISHYQTALQLLPRFSLAHRNYAKALFQENDLDNAIVQWRDSLAVVPNDPEAESGIADCLLKKGDITEAASHYEKALDLAPESATTLNNFALLLAIGPDQRLRDGRRAVELAQHADRLAGGKNPLFARTLALAYAEAGRFKDAIATAERALPIASAKGDLALVNALRLDLDLYRVNLPSR